MPNPNFEPNHPQYYSQPERYPLFEEFLGGWQPADEEERAVYNQNSENMKAFLQSQILSQTETPEALRKILAEVPGYRSKDIQRDARRLLSEEAREKILNLALNFQMSGQGISAKKRVNYLLMDRTDSPEAKAYNESIVDIIVAGTPERKGKLFDDCVYRSIELFRKSLNGFSDLELIENLKDLQKAWDVAMNAKNICNLADSGAIKITNRTREALEFMDANYLWINAPIQRVRAIANPTYEYVNIDVFLEMSSDEFDQLKKNTEGTYPGVYDYLSMIDSVRLQTRMLRDEQKCKLKASLEEVTKANKGFFIGSSAYSQAFRSLSEVTKLREAMNDHPSAEELENIVPRLQETIRKCKDYLETKDPKNFKNEREKIRYNAMKHAMESCQMDLDALNMKEKIKENEALNFSRPASDLNYPTHPHGDIIWKIHELYGTSHGNLHGKATNNTFTITTIPASNVGSIADELRADIHTHLNNLVDIKKTFDPELAGYVMANMVVLEMVKRQRSVDANGNHIAGPVEQKLASNPGALIESIRENRYLQNMIGEMTQEKLEHFIFTNGAKNVVNSIDRIAQQGRVTLARESKSEAQHQIGGHAK